MKGNQAIAADGQWVVDTLRELNRLTSDEEGAQRLAFTPVWARARDFLRQQLEELPVEIETDEVGNLWATLRGDDPDALVIGGHIDSVPNGGWLDGTLNVFAGLAVLRRLASEGLQPVTVRLVDWADEEGSRFGGHSMFGSGVTTGAIDPLKLADAQDREGVRLADAVAEFGIDLAEADRSAVQLANVRAYLELHIEQGPILESMGLPIAVVEGTMGIERHKLRVIGQSAHAGATPMKMRRDGLAAAARIILEMRRVVCALGGFGTNGQITVEPGVMTVVPGVCEISVDLRHGDQPTLNEMLSSIKEMSAGVAEAEGVTLDWQHIWSVPVTEFNPEMIRIGREAVMEASGSGFGMRSGTLHDAARMAHSGIPTVMIFVQSLHGLSHCKEEDTRPNDLALAVDALDRAASKVIARIADNSL